MKVRVKLFAVARELAGCDELAIDFPGGATVGDLRNEIVVACPALGRIAVHALWAVGTQYAGDDTRLDEKSDVAMIPPVSGG